MANFKPITKTEFADKRWQRPTSYAFASQDHVAPLVAQDMPKTALLQPVAFMTQGDKTLPVAIQGIIPGQNLMVTPAGKWRIGYIPAAYRGYPFNLAQDEKGQQHLCIDTDSGLISDSDGEPFFGEDGEASEPIKQILNFLVQTHKNRQLTEHICATLQQHDILEPWPITIKTSEGDKPVQGLQRINEKQLNALDTEAFDLVRKSGALPLIYCQLLSMQHFPNLIKLAAQLQPKAEPAIETLPDLDKLFGEGSDDMFRF